MKTVEKEIEIDQGAYPQRMTFNGSIPGAMMVVHEGDYVKLTVINPPENLLKHNIDVNAATGALGGGADRNRRHCRSPHPPPPIGNFHQGGKSGGPPEQMRQAAAFEIMKHQGSHAENAAFVADAQSDCRRITWGSDC